MAASPRVPDGQGEDPGWRRAVFAQLFPIGSRKTQRQLDGLIVTRVLFVALMQAALAGGLILVLITRHLGSFDTLPLLAVLVLGSAGVVVAKRTQSRNLDVTDATTLGASYRSRFFAGFIANEVPLLVALVMGMISGELWPYLVDLPFFIAGMFLIAPSRPNIERDQGILREGPSKLSLYAALKAPPAPPKKKG
ncbi:MAG: hypothetical protein QOH90_983 [Actinomycetota bacterium]|nr:hypothetical protein [Actinomycetota bacterium]